MAFFRNLATTLGIGGASMDVGGPSTSPDQWGVNVGLIKNGRFDDSALPSVIDDHLAGPWLGVEALPPHVSACALACALFATGASAEGRSVLERAYSLEVGGSEKWPGQQATSPALREWLETVASGSGWVTTATCAWLEEARQNTTVTIGPLGAHDVPGPNFLWLRRHNRALFYALHGSVRPVVPAEGIIGLVQRKAEKAAGRALPPCLDEIRSVLAQSLSQSDEGL